ncbi:MAG: amidohydrolase family protein [Sphingomonas sp.]
MSDVAPEETIFDTHAHVLSPDLRRYPYSTLRGGAKPPVSPMVFTVDDLVRAMDAAGVAHACIVQRATLYGYDNSYALDAAERFPERFVPIVVLDAQDPAAPDDLRALVAARGVAGLRIVAPTLTRDDTAWLDSDQALELWTATADLGLPATVILYRRNNEAGRAALLGIARRFTGLPILIDHVGLPHASTPETRYAASQGIAYEVPSPPGFGVEENLAAFADLGHVRFKVTDINFDRLEDIHADFAAFVRVLADRFGADRLLWGSDVGQSPVPYGEKVARLRDAARLLSDAERRSFFGGTAARLYGAGLRANAKPWDR